MEVSTNEVQEYIRQYEAEQAGEDAAGDSDGAVVEAVVVEAAVVDDSPAASTAGRKLSMPPSLPPPLPKRSPTKTILIGVAVIGLCAAAGLGVGMLFQGDTATEAVDEAPPAESVAVEEVEQAVMPEPEPELVELPLDELVVEINGDSEGETQALQQDE